MATITINNAPVRTLSATAVIYDSSKTQVASYTNADKIKSIEIQRTGEPNKFFGFGITHKLNLKLIDPNREINITTDNYILPRINSVYYPYFFVTEVHRDENTNELSITAYDAIYHMAKYTVSNLGLVVPYSMAGFVTTVVNKFQSIYHIDVLRNSGKRSQEINFNYSYPEGANFDGDESVRDALTMMSEAIGSIYYMEYVSDKREHRLVIDYLGNNEVTIDKENYFTLKVGNNRRLSAICSATSLGDNVIYNTGQTGTTQYIRDNAFVDLREDRATICEDLFFTLNNNIVFAQFDLDWRSVNTPIPPGTKLNLVAKDGTLATGYLINDTISYDGSLRAKTEWHYENANDNETANNPTSLGQALKKTYAQVDKVNQEIELVAKKADENETAISEIQIDTDSIKGSVQAVQKNLDEAIEGFDDDIDTLTKKVEATMTPEDVQIKITEALAAGVNEVTTTTGFTFNKDGLTVSKSGSEMTTNIDEDGMSIYRDNVEVLTADNTGVKALNLHAVTYLIIGNNSRFEDYTNTSGQKRTGCFWIG